MRIYLQSFFFHWIQYFIQPYPYFYYSFSVWGYFNFPCRLHYNVLLRWHSWFGNMAFNFPSLSKNLGDVGQKVGGVGGRGRKNYDLVTYFHNFKLPKCLKMWKYAKRWSFSLQMCPVIVGKNHLNITFTHLKSNSTRQKTIMKLLQKGWNLHTAGWRS